MEKIIETESEQETLCLAAHLAQNAKAGSVYALSGDLGVGKTVFAKGFALGLGVKDPITSPTFTLVHEYPLSQTKSNAPTRLIHFDLYRLSAPDELFEIGWDEYLSQNGVILAEWANLFPEEFPPETVWIQIDKDLTKSVSYRRITVYYDEETVDI